MEKNKELNTRTNTKAQKKFRATTHSPFAPFRYSASILPALLLLASPFSGTDTPMFTRITSITGRYQDIPYTLRP
jgi:hypothetical protein